MSAHKSRILIIGLMDDESTIHWSQITVSSILGINTRNEIVELGSLGWPEESVACIHLGLRRVVPKAKVRLLLLLGNLRCTKGFNPDADARVDLGWVRDHRGVRKCFKKFRRKRKKLVKKKYTYYSVKLKFISFQKLFDLDFFKFSGPLWIL